MRLNSGRACYHSVQNLRIYNTIIVSVGRYGFETRSLTLMNHRVVCIVLYTVISRDVTCLITLVITKSSFVCLSVFD
jgi:hypothetical protein